MKAPLSPGRTPSFLGQAGDPRLGRSPEGGQEEATLLRRCPLTLGIHQEGHSLIQSNFPSSAWSVSLLTPPPPGVFAHPLPPWTVPDPCVLLTPCPGGSCLPSCSTHALLHRAGRRSSVCVSGPVIKHRREAAGRSATFTAEGQRLKRCWTSASAQGRGPGWLCVGPGAGGRAVPRAHGSPSQLPQLETAGLDVPPWWPFLTSASRWPGPEGHPPLACSSQQHSGGGIGQLSSRRWTTDRGSQLSPGERVGWASESRGWNRPHGHVAEPDAPG